ncbi:two-component system sensor histidine kinase NtrB [Marinobacterium jannaschii]|uniref:two-component system sensor histidine kinase NtrB n=1 Tax=Marinobacterium jannaschii TaxID=64970 RepID=UPI000683EABB|nr:ATP-binding protein [Marinobacterium jannaschii]
MELVDQEVRSAGRNAVKRHGIYVAVCCSDDENFARLEAVLNSAAEICEYYLSLARQESLWGISALLQGHYYDLVLVNTVDLPLSCTDALTLMGDEPPVFGFLPLGESLPSSLSPQLFSCLNLNDPPDHLATQLAACLRSSAGQRQKYIYRQTQTLLLALHRLPFSGQILDTLLDAALAELNRVGYVDAAAQSAICLLYPGSQTLKLVAGCNVDEEAKLLIEAGLNLAIVNDDSQGERMLFHPPKTIDELCCLIPVYDNERLLGVVMFHCDRHFDIAELTSCAADEIATAFCSLITRYREHERVDRVYQQNNQLIESISSAIVGVDIYDCVSHWNHAAQHYLGLEAEEVLGRSIMGLPLEWSWKHISLQVLTCLTEKVTTERFEAPFTHVDGQVGVFSIVITPLLDERGNFGGYLMLLDDITTKVEAEKEAQQAERLKSIGQLAAGIAHEINTPIQYVGDNLHFLRDAFTDVAQFAGHCSEWVLKQPPGPEITRLQSLIDELELDYLMDEVPRAVLQALDGVDHVSRIVRAMKDFSHPGSDEKVETDINRVIQTTVTITRNIWKHIAELQLDLDPALPLIRTYPGPLSEVMLNLIVNASDAIADVVEGEEGTKGELRIASSADGSWLEIRVSDSGGGIPAEVQPFIFDQFFTTKPVGKGTGQGLSISHKVIQEQHGGTLTFCSEPGSGSCFIIRLPLSEGDQDEYKEETADPVSG